MTALSTLLTQCLQNDFVQPIRRFEPLPNHLHIGFDAARRLIGEEPDGGPVAMVMEWAYRQPKERLGIIHIRDWHDPEDPLQQEHFRQFGKHCVRETPGAAFAFPDPPPQRPFTLINSPGLNDFIDTPLQATLDASGAAQGRVGLIGVWTEAKISFLAYDLRSRYPEMEIAVCSALVAGSSRAHHFIALEHLRRILGVHVIASIGEFTRWLAGGEGTSIPLPPPRHSDFPSIIGLQGERVGETERALVRHLFRDCREVRLKLLDGGFSGNLVLGAESLDLQGRRQVPHVLKIGEEGPIGRERTAFEQIEEVLGNSAPYITEFADLNGKGALKYRYASMGGGFSTTFQKRYTDGLSHQKCETFLRFIFEQQLGRFYQAAVWEESNLLDYYWFSPERAPGVRELVEGLLGGPATGETLQLPDGTPFPNPCHFYEVALPQLQQRARGSAWFSYVHGDLNGANIIIDTQENVWLIDFFHTHQGHVLKDLIKLENDLLFIFTPLESDDDLAAARQLTDRLLDIHDLRRPLPEQPELEHPAMQRAYRTVRLLRSFYPDLVQHDRDPLQLFIGLLRYAAHTLSFDECNRRQKLWALYTAGVLAERITQRLKQRGPLRIDWIDPSLTRSGRLGITLLPGRKDYGRNLDDDLQSLCDAGVTHVVPLLPEGELEEYGVPDLLDAYRKRGLELYHLPIMDQSVSSREEMHRLTRWLGQQTETGHSVLIHCVGGLGRSGLAAGCYLKAGGMGAEEALAEVRRVRSQRAVESERQEAFLRQFTE